MFSWAKADFPCRDSCAYHGWQQLAEERRRGVSLAAEISAQTELATNKIVDIVKTVLPTAVKDKKKLLGQMIRSDLERISHWELLYDKVYFDLTGVSLRENGVDLTQSIDKIDRRELLRKGLHVSSLDKGIDLLVKIQAEIRRLKEYQVPEETEGTSVTIEPEETMSLEELRQQRTKLLEDKNIKIIDPPASG